jgi:hypothetical protein
LVLPDQLDPVSQARHSADSRPEVNLHTLSIDDALPRLKVPLRRIESFRRIETSSNRNLLESQTAAPKHAMSSI